MKQKKQKQQLDSQKPIYFNELSYAEKRRYLTRKQRREIESGSDHTQIWKKLILFFLILVAMLGISIPIGIFVTPAVAISVVVIMSGILVEMIFEIWDELNLRYNKYYPSNLNKLRYDSVMREKIQPYYQEFVSENYRACSCGTVVPKRFQACSYCGDNPQGPPVSHLDGKQLCIFLFAGCMGGLFLIIAVSLLTDFLSTISIIISIFLFLNIFTLIKSAYYTYQHLVPTQFSFHHHLIYLAACLLILPLIAMPFVTFFRFRKRISINWASPQERWEIHELQIQFCGSQPTEEELRSVIASHKQFL